MKKILMAAAAATAFISTTAWSAVTVDEYGYGFVGKGDVQLALGMNNKQLQTGASSLQFALTSTAESTWTCTKDSNGNTQERNRTVTSGGLVTTLARDNKTGQITGFTLHGFNGSTEVISSDGPALNSCPTGWTATDLETIGGGDGVVTVNGIELQ